MIKTYKQWLSIWEISFKEGTTCLSLEFLGKPLYRLKLCCRSRLCCCLGDGRHRENMAQQTVDFSHEGFQGRIKALQDNISYSGAAENIAYNMGYEDPVNRAVAGWIESDGHRQNMIRNYDLTGIGVAVNQEGEYYFTQIFIREN